jgi:hypothetical protein
MHRIGCLFCLLAAGAVSGQGEQPPVVVVDTEDDDAGLWVELGVDIVSAYWWRGYVYENAGLIAQPRLEFGFPVGVLGDDDTGIAVDAYFGLWNSLHSKKTEATGVGWDAWYEADLYAGLTFGLGDIELSLEYAAYIYPNDSAFDPVHAIEIVLDYDMEDGGVVERILGDPSLSLYFEVDRSNVGDEEDEAAFLGLSFGPGFELNDDGVTLSIPMELGFSLDNFYTDSAGADEVFGYFSVGADLEIPLPSAGADWTLNTGVTLVLLGDNARDANGTDAAEAFAYLSLTWSF